MSARKEPRTVTPGTGRIQFTTPLAFPPSTPPSSSSSASTNTLSPASMRKTPAKATSKVTKKKASGASAPSLSANKKSASATSAPSSSARKSTKRALSSTDNANLDANNEDDNDNEHDNDGENSSDGESKDHDMDRAGSFNGDSNPSGGAGSGTQYSFKLDDVLRKYTPEEFKICKAYDVGGVNILNKKPIDSKAALDKIKRRRETHNRVERRRRDCINQLMEELTTLLPLEEDQNSKCHRVNVLRTAVAHIQNLTRHNDSLNQQLAAIKEGRPMPPPAIITTLAPILDRNEDDLIDSKDNILGDIDDDDSESVVSSGSYAQSASSPAVSFTSSSIDSRSPISPFPMGHSPWHSPRLPPSSHASSESIYQFSSSQHSSNNNNNNNNNNNSQYQHQHRHLHHRRDSYHSDQRHSQDPQSPPDHDRHQEKMEMDEPSGTARISIASSASSGSTYPSLSDLTTHLPSIPVIVEPTEHQPSGSHARRLQRQTLPRLQLEPPPFQGHHSQGQYHHVPPRSQSNSLHPRHSLDGYHSPSSTSSFYSYDTSAPSSPASTYSAMSSPSSANPMTLPHPHQYQLQPQHQQQQQQQQQGSNRSSLQSLSPLSPYAPYSPYSPSFAPHSPQFPPSPSSTTGSVSLAPIVSGPTSGTFPLSPRSHSRSNSHSAGLPSPLLPSAASLGILSTPHEDIHAE